MSTNRRSCSGRVLVVSHEASRTGAPRVAADVARALVGAGHDVRVVLRWGGPMRSEFVATGARVNMEPMRRLRVVLRRWARTRWLATWIEQVAAGIQILTSRPEVVWCNTVLSACYIRPARLLGKRVVLHVHEPPDRMRQVLGRYCLDGYWSMTSLVACSPTTGGHLVAITGEQATCIPSVPDGSRVRHLADEGPSPTVGIVVGGCGTADYRKGVDLWLEMAARVRTACADLNPQFVWVGPLEAPMDAPPDVSFTGPVANPYRWIREFAVFTLMSRVDVFPLVVLEAMALGRPVVSFDVGDVAAQVGEAGILVPLGDVDLVARRVESLLRDPVESRRRGDAGRDRVEQCYTWSRFASDVNHMAFP